MSLFEDAARIFDTATRADGPADFGILVDDCGAVRVVSADGWRPDTLQAHYGVPTVFQVTRGDRGVRVAARSGQRSCTLASESPASVLRSLDHLGRAGLPLDLPRQALL